MLLAIAVGCAAVVSGLRRCCHSVIDNILAKQNPYMLNPIHKNSSGGDISAQPKGVDPDSVPLGTALPGTGCGSILTCSDKISGWNALGIQGAKLCRFIQPTFLTTITVGRKFSPSVCQRALCCRLQDFHRGKNPQIPSGFGIHHPVLLGTAVKLDDSWIQNGENASFDSAIALYWSDKDKEAGQLDSYTGNSKDASTSVFIARHHLDELHEQIEKQSAEVLLRDHAQYEEDYRLAQEALKKYVERHCSILL